MKLSILVPEVHYISKLPLLQWVFLSMTNYYLVGIIRSDLQKSISSLFRLINTLCAPHYL